jgi:superfamily I DNA and RNA helicase
MIWQDATIVMGDLESGEELALHRPVPISPDALFTDEESEPVGSNA